MLDHLYPSDKLVIQQP